MKKLYILALLVFHISITLYGQQTKNKFQIRISDNHNIQNEAWNYTITGDSLIITGLSDYGKSTVEYMRKKLTAEEKKKLQDFMLKFHIDKFNELYFKDYANLGYITPEHYPRVIDMEISNLGKSKKIRINNSWVPEFAALFKAINPLLPVEVRIKYEEQEF